MCDPTSEAQVLFLRHSEGLHNLEQDEVGGELHDLYGDVLGGIPQVRGDDIHGPVLTKKGIQDLKTIRERLQKDMGPEEVRKYAQEGILISSPQKRALQTLLGVFAPYLKDRKHKLIYIDPGLQELGNDDCDLPETDADLKGAFKKWITGPAAEKPTREEIRACGNCTNLIARLESFFTNELGDNHVREELEGFKLEFIASTTKQDKIDKKLCRGPMAPLYDNLNKRMDKLRDTMVTKALEFKKKIEVEKMESNLTINTTTTTFSEKSGYSKVHEAQTRETPRIIAVSHGGLTTLFPSDPAFFRLVDGTYAQTIMDDYKRTEEGSWWNLPRINVSFKDGLYRKLPYFYWSLKGHDSLQGESWILDIFNNPHDPHDPHDADGDGIGDGDGVGVGGSRRSCVETPSSVQMRERFHSHGWRKPQFSNPQEDDRIWKGEVFRLLLAANYLLMPVMIERRLVAESFAISVKKGGDSKMNDDGGSSSSSSSSSILDWPWMMGGSSINFTLGDPQTNDLGRIGSHF